MTNRADDSSCSHRWHTTRAQPPLQAMGRHESRLAPHGTRHRAGVINRRRQPEQLRPKARLTRLSEEGEPLTKDGPDSAWQRLIKASIRDGVISDEQRFNLHDLKR